MNGPEAFAPTDPATATAFVDSSALFALFNPRDERHRSAKAFHEYCEEGALSYSRLVTNDHVLDEVATRLRRRVNHGRAVRAIEGVEKEERYVLACTGPETYRRGVRRFVDYHDIDLSFTDCVVAAHMDDAGIDHVFTYDGDFAAFDCTVIPHYVA